jgi:RHS repeat-associated protein
MKGLPVYQLTGVRDYDPQTGRFLQPDPFKGYLSEPTSQNPYMYCRGNPIKYSDPSGYDYNLSKQQKIELIHAVGQTLSGYALMLLGGTMTGGGGAMSATGVGAIPGVPLSIEEAAVTGTGFTLGTTGLIKTAAILRNASNGGGGEQDKRLSAGEIRRMEERGVKAEEVKKDYIGPKNISCYDLFKDKEGVIKIKPKSGSGEGVVTDYNIKDF